MVGLPLIKLGALVFKQCSKKLVSSVKKQALRSPEFRKAAIYLGRKMDNIEYRFRTGKEKPFSSREEKAIESFAEFLGESMLLLIFSLILMGEYWHGIRSNREKEIKVKEKEVLWMEALEKQGEDIARLEKIVETMAKKMETIPVNRKDLDVL